jgi:O-acetyl-ADP-ribose deacetylase (regulator of RNase III)
MITRYIQGDITQTELKIIAHGVNCQNTMGSGVAKALFTKWPEVKARYHRYFCRTGEPEDFLGDISTAKIDDMIVLNMHTQLNFGYDGKKYVNYAAVSKCFATAADLYRGQTIAIPKIGCGLAGGNWTFMEQLINDAVSDRIEIWVYEMNTTTYSGKNDNA